MAMIPKSDVCRLGIRPVPRPECGYNEHLSRRMPSGLASDFRAGTADAENRPGLNGMRPNPLQRSRPGNSLFDIARPYRGE